MIDDAVITRYKDNKPINESMKENGEVFNEQTKIAKRGRFKFSMVNIKVGEYITFTPTNLQVKVASDDTVEYDGRIYKLSPFVGTFMPKKGRHNQELIKEQNISHTMEKYWMI